MHVHCRKAWLPRTFRKAEEWNKSRFADLSEAANRNNDALHQAKRESMSMGDRHSLSPATWMHLEGLSLWNTRCMEWKSTSLWKLLTGKTLLAACKMGFRK